MMIPKLQVLVIETLQFDLFNLTLLLRNNRK
jgi:hypothetical protein